MEKKFKREYLIEELDLPFNAVDDKIVNRTRWELIHEIIFQDTDGTYWRTQVRDGATELQETIPWEYEDEVECEQVEKRLVLRKEWVPIEQKDGFCNDL